MKGNLAVMPPIPPSYTFASKELMERLSNNPTHPHFFQALFHIDRDQAAKWMAHNTSNRPVIANNVRAWIDRIERGSTELSHQGMAFSKSGRLLDGQHRLLALLNLPAGHILTQSVTFGLEEKAFSVMDRGSGRSLADSTQEDKRLIAAAAILLGIHVSAGARIDGDLLSPYVDLIRDVHARLILAYPKTSKVWSSALVQAAACMAVLFGSEEEYVFAAYSALVYQKYDEMPPVISCLCRQITELRVRRADTELVTRVMYAFNHRKKSIEKIYISSSDSREQMAAIRNYLTSRIGEPRVTTKRTIVTS